jgi:sugar fermentation stimulation protein A
MIFEAPLLHGILVRRYRRFLAEIQLASGEIVAAHCPNSGSMKGVNLPGHDVLISYQGDPRRHLHYTWEMIHADGDWVGINTLVPNRIVAEALETDRIPALHRYSEYRSEVMVTPHTRIDFVLGKSGRCWLEVKNVSLVENGVAKFPDSVTERGAKHLREMTKHVRNGGKAVALYVVQHHAANVFTVADEIDPVYGKMLRAALTAGVHIEVWKAKVTPQEIHLDHTLPVSL